MRSLVLCLVVGCTGEIGLGETVDGGLVDPVDAWRVDGGAKVDAAPGGCGDPTGDRKTLVCRRWTCDRAALDEGEWAGDVDTCQAADSPAVGRENALRLVNLYRFLADLPPVSHDPGRNGRAQACALMMDANDALDHDPPADWKCYSEAGAQGAGTSNIASAPGVTAVDMYMSDFGNSTTMGHRRWLLSNSLGPIGLGSTASASCALVLGGQGDAGKAWMAWPPPGPFPHAAFAAGGFGQTVDETGWTVQSDAIDLGGASVTVREGGNLLPVATNVLGAGYGSASAIRFVPEGWEAQAGKTYEVSLAGVSTPIRYAVEVVDCP